MDSVDGNTCTIKWTFSTDKQKGIPQHDLLFASSIVDVSSVMTGSYVLFRKRKRSKNAKTTLCELGLVCQTKKKSLSVYVKKKTETISHERVMVG